ncbi:unnamed protein product [Ectocarpus fasciculatus]
MASRLAVWQCGLVFLVACFPRQASSFLACPAAPRAASRPARASTTAAATPEGEASAQEGTTSTPAPAARRSLDRSAPVSFIAKNNVNLDGDFISSREGGPTAEELSNENIIKVVAEKSTDEEVNVLAWKCLGYRYDAGEDAWKAVKVFSRWEAVYPEPPDFLGVTRVYEKSIDKPVMKAVQLLTRGVPTEYKRCIVEQLRPLGFTGLKMDELTPNRTRRAQVTNFLLYFRDNLWGVPLEEVERRRVERIAAAKREAEAEKRVYPSTNEGL